MIDYLDVLTFGQLLTLTAQDSDSAHEIAVLGLPGFSPCFRYPCGFTSDTFMVFSCQGEI